ncbi:Sirohydrochlorin ferrochelatase [Streptoalloteichus tenebrarius]|uniref:Sirohydrochlorin ferrochelatase n=1 Tax=Streptoalloteichus tenebrarius (strain ATCC 17920 / DSM 40477 / JCM 4838 / CBS 697.72 / NBRC 16177 / NCIMB 11028 / NRRL B-12390 / A12253. 1 / ISP 5477) TaxID=1933 RepID=A0ABT1HVR7_STRSD|nr:sirohydrochlorin chelatase [Streptoalloteichus tenebrarius]MCP2259619.1 Sirohydrochlorin ferrochelatase [Streptoalloteichus tenebrarius]BFF00975.1 sirohydrochlorin chelatase [Streptoalloteichus tenebrarius]
MTLVLVAHGSRDPVGGTVVRRIAASLRERLAGVSVRVAFADVARPTLGEVLRRVRGPAVVVPAFLAAGYHVRVDLPGQIAASERPDAVVTPALGPHPALVAAAAERLRVAGRRPGDAIVLAAAGSSDPRALGDVRRAALLLEAWTGERVRTAFITTSRPRVEDVVAELRAEHQRVVISSWLLAPGVFHRALVGSGADAVADPLGAHPRVVDLVVRRYVDARFSGDRAA